MAKYKVQFGKLFIISEKIQYQMSEQWNSQSSSHLSSFFKDSSPPVIGANVSRRNKRKEKSRKEVLEANQPIIEVDKEIGEGELKPCQNTIKFQLADVLQNSLKQLAQKGDYRNLFKCYQKVRIIDQNQQIIDMASTILYSNYPVSERIQLLSVLPRYGEKKRQNPQPIEKSRKKYVYVDRDKKDEAVRRLEAGQQRLCQIAKELNVSTSTIKKHRDFLRRRG